MDVAVQSRGQWFHKATPSKIIMKKIESNQRVEQSTDQRIQANIKELTQDLIPSKEILPQLLQLNFGHLHLKRLHEKSREEKGKESEVRRR